MEKQQENKLGEVFISATVDELNLASNLIFAALTHMTNLHEQERKMARHFMVKLQRGVLSSRLNKQSAH